MGGGGGDEIKIVLESDRTPRIGSDHEVTKDSHPYNGVAVLMPW